MTINEVAKKIEKIDLAEVFSKNTKFIKKIDETKFMEKVMNAFEGYNFNGKDKILFSKEFYNKWDFSAKAASCDAPLVRIYLKAGCQIRTEVVSL